MSTGFFEVPIAFNEPVYGYEPGSNERKLLKKAIKSAYSQVTNIPMFIGGKEITTDNKIAIHPPHKLSHTLGYFYKGDKKHVKMAIDAALHAKKQWAELPWENRVSVFLKAADLLAGPYRYKMNAATMIAQSKNPFQSEIDAVCELIDFFRFNAQFATEIYSQQPESAPEIWNRLEQRPLEGFVTAISPFNFTSIGGNLPTAPAIMGNTVVWKPAADQAYSAKVIMDVLREAGLPDGVINMIFVPGKTCSDVCLNHPDLAGIHFTGSTKVFQGMWKTIGQNIDKYKSYPRIVGETGGKDFIVMHESANVKATVTALIRGAFEYQGQKCSAVSRAYIPSNKWNEVKAFLVSELKTVKVGEPEDFTNFVNAVINENAFDDLASHIDNAKKSKDAEIIAGGKYDKSKGYFIHPTVIHAKDPKYTTMCEELFGPVLTIYVYDSEKFSETLELVDNTSPYALTGAIFSKDRYAIEEANKKLVNAAGNYYINDKPTGAVVGQQPFGGARASGTNDKAGFSLNLLRWVSPRTMKENFNPPEDYRYSFMNES